MSKAARKMPHLMTHRRVQQVMFTTLARFLGASTVPETMYLVSCLGSYWCFARLLEKEERERLRCAEVALARRNSCAGKDSSVQGASHTRKDFYAQESISMYKKIICLHNEGFA